jgi:hypothetical protein
VVGFVERLSDRLLGRILPELTAKAAGHCHERCFCAQGSDGRIYEFIRDCDCTSGICGGCYFNNFIQC